MNKEVKITLSAVLGILIICVLGYVFYYFVFSSVSCFNFECFSQNMKECRKTHFINEDPQATWKYEIKGIEEDNCKIDVTLLRVKEGELQLEKLEGLSMICSYSEGFSAYPEKDLSKCHGILKEELQTKIIEKLHSVILENLKSFNQELSAF